MSHSLSPEDRTALQAVLTEFGAAANVHLIHAEADEVAAATLLRRARSVLAEALANDKVSLRELARRIGVSPAAVSRVMNSDSDLQLGTLAVYAHAVGREWTLAMRQIDHGRHQAVNYRVVPPLAAPPATTRFSPRHTGSPIVQAVP